MDFTQDIDLTTRAAAYMGQKVLMVNSTKVGGGPAIMLGDVVALMDSLGINAKWLDINAPESFFQVTKDFHNMIQGHRMPEVNERIASYEAFYKENFEAMNRELLTEIREGDYDFIIIHDPQPMKIVDYRGLAPKAKWIWRCHVDLTDPEPRLWEYVNSYAEKYDSVVVTDDSFKKRDDYHVVRPSINPHSDINKELSQDEVLSLLEEHSIPLDKPLITQISRFDRWKDPVGVLKVFEKVRDAGFDCRLVIKAEFADDNPEGAVIKGLFDEALIQSRYRDDVIVNLSRDKVLVNALQRAASVVLQKSLREGFALTVSEALWKGTPVIGSNVGGIPLQISDGETGFLINLGDYERHIEDTASKVMFLLQNPYVARMMGERGKAHVARNFLTKHHVLAYLKLFSGLKGQEAKIMLPQTSIA